MMILVAVYAKQFRKSCNDSMRTIPDKNEYMETLHRVVSEKMLPTSFGLAISDSARKLFSPMWISPLRKVPEVILSPMQESFSPVLNVIEATQLLETEKETTYPSKKEILLLFLVEQM